MKAAPDIAARRLSLILAAERLFADQGLEAVSLSQVNQAAGHRNASAVHYHFGSRDGLVEAVFDHRMGLINPRRLAIMDRLAEEGRLTELRPLVCAWVQPFAEELKPRDEGNYSLRFLERLLRDEPLFIRRNAIKDLGAFWVTGWKVAEALEALLTYLPPQIARMRLKLLRLQVISGLAAIEARGDHEMTDFQIEALIDCLVGGLTAPVSHQAMQALRGGTD
ncbi:TetR/AcrR family transcriptional regulator [Rhizorhabdus dicambivorans]|uniref:TetR/AcrR family transcriptional regulator n=1 Tax=Rhizorhabdus dicambivorans TaxID=1850238 RepID=A0A2A4FZB5_9SPHN|nr:TetR/AcrR family transcriptional regulator [Rhizorhabdus dicambivorans]ATE63644.1 TetR/AcrR family transcriptional regulator [Rhizorhabdus dicambivorans]PCE42772.1 TetR/AcrR family transcriptional regulator [Rhizorhabdus dicambivorans]